MKPRHINRFLASAVFTMTACASATATQFSWTGNTDTAWATGTNWTGVPDLTAPANSITTDSALFNLLVAPTNQPNAGTTSITGIQIGTGAATTALTLSGTQLTTGASGIDMKALAAASSVTSPITLGAAQTWQNASANLLTIGTGAITNGGFLLTVGGAGNTTISSIISGSGGVTKTGSGMLTLSGANNYTGATTISAGTLEIGDAGQLLGSSGTYAANIANTGTLSVNSTADNTFSGVISGGGALFKANSGTLTLTGANTYTGATTVNGGVLVIGGTGGRLGNNSNTMVASGATLQFTTSYHGNSTPYAGALTGAGNVDINNLYVVFSGNNEGFSGTVNVLPSMRLNLNNANAGSANATWNVNASLSTNVNSTSFNFGALTGNGSLAPGGGAINQTYVIGNLNTDCTFAGVVGGSALVTKVGTGTLTLTGANTYTGATKVSAGSLTIPVAQSSATFTVADTATLNLTGFPGTSFSVTNLTLGTSGATTLRIGNFGGKTLAANAPVKAATLFTAAGTVTLKVSGSFAGVTASGVYPLISYPATGYTGGSFAALSVLQLPLGVIGTLVDNPTNKTVDLSVTSFNPLTWDGTTNGVWDIATTANWLTNPTAPDGKYLDNAIVLFGEATTGTKSVTLDTTVTPADVIVNNTSAYTISGSGTIAGTTGLTKKGAGTLTLSTANTYTGATLITAGTLALSGGANRLPVATTLNFTAASTLDVGDTAQTLAQLSVANSTTATVTGTGGSLNLGSNHLSVIGLNQNLDLSQLDTFTFNGPAKEFQVGGNVDASTSTVSLAKTSTITTSFLRVNDRFCGTNIQAFGYLKLGTVQTTINANNIYIGYTSGGAYNYDTGYIQGGSGNLKLRNTAGDGRITEIKVGRLDSNSYTTHARGTLNLSAVTTDAMVTALTIGQTTGNNGGNVGNGTVTLGAGTFDVTNIYLATHYSTGNFGTTLGDLTVANGGLLKADAIRFGNNRTTATLNLNGGSTLAAHSLAEGASPTVITSTINWNNGTIRNYNSTTDLSIGTGVNIVLAATGTHTFDIDTGRTGTVSSVISGTNSALTKTGDGTLTLTGANTYTGNTTVTDGELQLGGAGQLGSGVYADTIALSAGATFKVNSTALQTLSGAITDAGGLVKENTGTLILSNAANTYSGATTLNAGTLSLTGSLTGGTAIAVNNAAVLTQDAASVISGAASYNQSSSATSILAGANTYAGGTTVSGGTLIGTSVSALGTNSGLTLNGGVFAYRPTAAGALNLGTGVVNLASGSRIGTALGGTASQSAITSTGAAVTVPGTVTVDIWTIPGVAPTAGSHDLITAGSGLNTATYVVGNVYNATDFTVSGLTQSDTAVSVTASAAPALTAEYWKGGFSGASGVWAVSNGSTTSNWASDSSGTPTSLIPGSTATITFSATGATNQGAMVLGLDMSVLGMVVDDAAGITLNADGKSLTVGTGGLTANTGAGAIVINAPITLVGALTANTGAGAITFNAAATLSGGITTSGTAGTVTLAGTTTLSGGITTSDTAGAVTLTGTTTLGAAQAWTNNSSNALTVSGNVANGDFLLTSGGTGNSTISGILSGTGGLTKADAGTLTLSNAGTNYTGPTTVNGGVLVLSNTTGLATAMTINNGGTVRNADSTNRSIGANFLVTLNGGTYEHKQNFYRTHAGLLTVAADSVMNNTNTGNTTQLYWDGGATGSGNLTINNTGNSTQTGPVFRNAGTGSPSLSGVVTVNGGIVGYGTSAVALRDAKLDLVGATLAMTNANSVAITATNQTVGSLSGDATSLVVLTTQLTTGGRNDDTTFAGVISGAAGKLFKEGTGTLELTGANTYTGITTVSGGTLAVNNTTGSGTGTGTVTVKTTGTLAGSGTVTGATTIQNTGVLSPGNAGVGTLNFGGDLILNVDSYYAVQVTSGTASDKVNLPGKTLTANGTITFTAVGHTYAIGNTYDIADAATITGTPTISPATPGLGLAWDTSTFTTDGTIKVITGDPYEGWAGPSGYNLIGLDAAKGADPDGDGSNNLLEFATNSDPTSATTGPRIYSAMVTIGAENVLTYTMAVRKGTLAAFASPASPDEAKKTATRDKVKYTVEATNDFGDWVTVPVTEVTDVDEIADVHTALGDKITTPVIDGDWEWKTFRTDGGAVADPSDFIRLKVEEVTP